jgi:hypothetical protein
VAPKIGRGDSIAGGAKLRCQESIRGAEIAHSGHEDDQRSSAVDVIGNPSVGATKVAGFLDEGRGFCLHDGYYS